MTRKREEQCNEPPQFEQAKGQIEPGAAEPLGETGEALTDTPWPSLGYDDALTSRVRFAFGAGMICVGPTP